jgi:hypothetical protein
VVGLVLEKFRCFVNNVFLRLTGARGLRFVRSLAPGRLVRSLAPGRLVGRFHGLMRRLNRLMRWLDPFLGLLYPLVRLLDPLR